MMSYKACLQIQAPERDTTTISRLSSRHLMWSFPQMIAHHTLGGCPLRTGDLLGSGTISGTESHERGSMLEMSDGGKKDILLAGMDVRRFLKDGDIVNIRGRCGSPGQYVGFGHCAGRIQTAINR
jgi:fumarylacetoacetase